MYDLRTLVDEPRAFDELKACLSGEAPVCRIREAKIKLTARCNLRCAFCRLWQIRDQEELTTAEVFRLIDELADLDCRKVHLSGGESTLRSDLIPIVAHAAARGIRTSLTTNGTTMTDELARGLLGAGLRSLTMSLDGVTPARHDALRGVKGAFKRTLVGLKAVRQAKKALKTKTKIRLNMVLTRHNYHEYPDILALAGEHGVTDVTCIPVDEKAQLENRLLPWQLQEYNESMAPAVEEIRRQYGFSTEPHLIYPFGRGKDDLHHAANAEYARGYFRRHLCYVPWLTTLVIWNGDVFLCCMTRGRDEPLGNVRGTAFRDIYLGEPYEAVRRQFRQKRFSVCHRCDDFLAENMFLQSALDA